MMVAAVVRFRQLALAVDRAAELAAPDDQRVVQQPALLQIADQRRRRLIGVAALEREIARQIVVLVPAAMIELDEAHVALGQPAREQAIRREGAGLPRFRTVHLERAVRFLRQDPSGPARRSACGTPSRTGDARLDLRIAVLLGVLAIQLRHAVEHPAARRPRDASASSRYSTGSLPERKRTP